jgi:hypothetical protein
MSPDGALYADMIASAWSAAQRNSFFIIVIADTISRLKTTIPKSHRRARSSLDWRYIASSLKTPLAHWSKREFA